MSWCVHAGVRCGAVVVHVGSEDLFWCICVEDMGGEEMFLVHVCRLGE